jgi:hypothetical protein
MKISIGVCCTCIIAAVMPTNGSAQGGGSGGQRLSFQHVSDKARTATASRPPTVRALVDEVFDRSLFGGASTQLRDRIYRADLEFRRGTHGGTHGAIPEAVLVQSANDLVKAYGAPDFAGTTVAQVRAFREMTRQLVPYLGAENGVQRQLQSAMSPVEAVYVATMLATQKMHNPHFQVPPEEWVAAYHAKNARGVSRAAQNEAVVTRIPTELAKLNWALEHDLQDDSTNLSVAAHAFLDRLGIAR